MHVSMTGSWAINNIEYGANTIISIPSPITGIIIIGSTSMTYYNSNGNQQSVEISPTMVLSYVSICNDGTRYLYSDHRGLLSVLALRIDSSYGNGNIIIGGSNSSSSSSSSSYLGINNDNINNNNNNSNNTIDNIISSGSNIVTSIVVDMIGTTSIATSLAYLSYAILYIGSQYGDNQLIKLYPEKKMIEDDDSYDVEDDEDDRDHDQIFVDDILIDNDDDNINNNNNSDRRSKSSNSNKMSRYNDTSSSNSSRSNNNNMFEILSTYTNIGPILDMCLIEHDKHSGGQRQLITCSGAYND
jgi:hypothetical protein